MQISFGKLSIEWRKKERTKHFWEVREIKIVNLTKFFNRNIFSYLHKETWKFVAAASRNLFRKTCKFCFQIFLRNHEKKKRYETFAESQKKGRMQLLRKFLVTNVLFFCIESFYAKGNETEAVMQLFHFWEIMWYWKNRAFKYEKSHFLFKYFR